MNAVQVYIPTLQVGALAQENGRYLLVNVPAGTHVLRTERIGFRPVEQEVTVVAGQAVEANFILDEDALALDEIIVTGTAGQARRREVGNTVAQINIAEVAEPVANVDNLI
ncbi:MAG: carboxypeptidase-like regulatory domain-containing protein [Gammaproteobacteria bacterium]|nr:carboxypeptidase-like regulatory domain-containing protein [Gammaproteobacteria bacterium]